MKNIITCLILVTIFIIGNINIVDANEKKEKKAVIYENI